MSPTASQRLMALAQNDATSMMAELGTTGLEQYNGLIHEEFLNRLRGQLGIRAYREMENNDPIIGAMLFAIEMLLRPVTWSVEAYDDSAEAAKDAELVEQVAADMEHSWASFIGEWMAAPVYGFAPFEIVWKQRQGYNRNPELSSMYSDGAVGIAKLGIRHPSSLERWLLDEHSRVEAMVQRGPPDFVTRVIPAEKLLLFTVLQRKGNPEGTSLLRRAFVPYYRKKHIEEIEAIGIERELAGLPVFKTPPEWWLADASAEGAAMLATIKKIARRLKTDEQGGIVMPNIIDAESKQPLLTFELVSTGGTRAIDTGPAKEYYSRQMAMSILADVILIGHEKVGSFALADSKTNLFSIGLGALLDDIEDTINRQLLPRLMRLNGRDPARAPKLKHGDVETPDLASLAEYVSKLAGAGMTLFPTEDGELERVLLRAANLPESVADNASELYQERQEARQAALDAMAGAGPLPDDEDGDSADGGDEAT